MVFGALFADDKVTLSQIQEAPAYKENEAQVIAKAEEQLGQMETEGAVSPAQAKVMRGWFKDLPFRRVIDVEVVLPGFPDTLGLCLEGNPHELVSIEACAAATLFMNSISANVKSRFVRWMNLREEHGKIKGWTFSAGPAIGARHAQHRGFIHWGEGNTVDGFLSAEWVRWWSKNFGLGLQVDAGVSYGVDGIYKDRADLTNPIPLIRFSTGFNF
jgi:hypothetical protein